ncbi:hypothetical protein B7L28_04890 [Veillonella atypica]|nr:hypothetical protein B7L28_04890 [Veillonella atypica]
MNLIKVIKVLLFMTFFLGVSIPVMASTISHPNHYDHATIGEHFDPYSMVTKMTGSRYDRMGKNLFGVMNTLMEPFVVS